MQYQIFGHTHKRFDWVHTIFDEQFARHGEIGASLCVWHQGQCVVDLWGGYQDLKAGIPWKENTLTNVFSVTKGLVALCFLMLVDRGLIEYDDLVVRYWPTFADHDPQKANITIRMLLNHRSGLLGFREALTWEELQDDVRLQARLEREPLAWEANQKQGYHGVTFGLYSKILFQAICQESIGQFLAREVVHPLQADVYLGLPTDLYDRCAPIFPTQPFDVLTGIIPQLATQSREGKFFRSVLLGGAAKLAFGQPAYLGAKGLKNFNSLAVKQVELPWANAQANARGIATIYNALLTDHCLVKPESLAQIMQRQSWADQDEVLRKPMGFSLGFVKEQTELFSPNQVSFGHPGAGGALGWADPQEKLAIGYVMNRMGYHVRSPRALNLCHAIYKCL